MMSWVAPIKWGDQTCICKLFDQEAAFQREAALYRKLAGTGLCPQLAQMVKKQKSWGLIIEKFDGHLGELLDEMEPNIPALVGLLHQIYRQNVTLNFNYGYSHGDFHPGNILYKKNPDGSIRLTMTDFEHAHLNTTEEMKWNDLLRLETYFQEDWPEYMPKDYEMPDWTQINYRFDIPAAIREAYHAEE